MCVCRGRLGSTRAGGQATWRADCAVPVTLWLRAVGEYFQPEIRLYDIRRFMACLENMVPQDEALKRYGAGMSKWAHNIKSWGGQSNSAPEPHTCDASHFSHSCLTMMGCLVQPDTYVQACA